MGIHPCRKCGKKCVQADICSKCEKLSRMPKQERKRTQDVDLVEKMLSKVKTTELQSVIEEWLSKQLASGKKRARFLDPYSTSSSDRFAD